MLAASKAKIEPGRLLINGQWTEGSKSFDTMNPATGEVLTQVAEASAADVDRAVQAARQAFEDRAGGWRKLSASERGRLIWKLADLVEKNIEELAELETLDNGKPIFESRYVDLPMVIDVLRYYAGLATKIHGETVNTFEAAFTYTLREPVGVVGLIVPWNFPLLLASWKVGPALACGNTIVLKPAEQTPLTTLRFGELVMEAGFPAGVVNIVTGGPETGKAIVAHPGIDKIAFTGSTAVGKEIMRGAADTLKRVTLELGGKSPNIVFSDADVDNAVKGAINGIFYGKGEVCNAGSRLFLESKLRDEFTEKLVARASKDETRRSARSQDATGSHCQPGADADRSELYRRRKERWGKAGCGRQSRVGRRRQGLLHRTHHLRRSEERHEDRAEEIFGPVLSVLAFDDIDEVIEQANNNAYGLAAAVWTRDVKKAHSVSRRLKAGTVWINTYGLMDAALPFGGYKSSGFGRELGAHAIEHYTELKTVWLNMG